QLAAVAPERDEKIAAAMVEDYILHAANGRVVAHDRALAVGLVRLEPAPAEFFDGLGQLREEARDRGVAHARKQIKLFGLGLAVGLRVLRPAAAGGGQR